MATYSIDINIRKKIFDIPLDPIGVNYTEPISNVPTLTNSSVSKVANIIATKPQLITKAELENLGNNINLVGYDPLANLITNSNKTFSPKLLNWVEPYNIEGSDTYKTLFYTEVNTELKVGDKVYILNGNYDSDLLIKKNKYKKGRDGYKVLYVDNCKVALDIDYTGVLPYVQNNDDEFIKVYYIKDKSEFLHANRSVTTKNGQFENKFSYNQNSIIYVDSSYSISEKWGLNSGVVGPGFYVRSSTASWVDVTSQLTSGTYSFIGTSNDRVKIFNGDFTHAGIEYKEGFIYKWNVGPIQSSWIVDVTYYAPYISKSNFRDGIFNGKWNSGVFGQYYKTINWDGNGSSWSIGTLVNTKWKKGIIDSLYTASQSYFSSFDNNGLPYQKANSPNNAGRGYNFVLNSKIEQSTVINGSIYTTKFGTQSTATYSIVENEILGYNTDYLNTIKSAFFNNCEFNNSYLENAELKNTRSNNSKFEKVKSINSYFNNSVLKNSSYNSDNIIKIFAYDEFSASEYPSLVGATYSYIDDVVQKVYKFYIDKNGYDRLKTGDTFYLKGIRINDKTKNVINFFDKKFKIGTWTEYTEDNFGTSINGKRGWQYSAFLSTPLDNSYKFTSATFSMGSSVKYKTITYESNPNNKYYSIDIWVSRYDINDQVTSNFENLNYNTDTTVYDVSLLKGPNSLGNIIDINSAYIVDSDFDSGLIENSDWNSGSHIESNNDNNITIPSLSGGTYNLSINNSNYIVATTSYNSNYSESDLMKVGDIVFLDSVDFNYGTISRIPDAYKIISNNNGVYQLKEVGTSSQIISLSASNGYFYTNKAQNRYNHIKKLKIDKSNIKSGFLRRSYITNSLIQNSELNYLDKDLSNLENIRNLVISDSLFSDNGNILSNATYENSFFLEGTDKWNSGIIQNSIWVNGTFSNGVIRDSRWVNGNFLNGWFYNSKTFNGKSTDIVHENSFVYLDSGMDSYTVNLPSTGSYVIEFTVNRLDDLRISDGPLGGGGGIELDIIPGTGTITKYKNTFTFSTPYVTFWNFLNNPANISLSGIVIKKVLIPYYYSENINSYYKSGTLPNNRNSWQNGKFLNGEFFKSDWESGTFSNGRFYYSNFYDGYITNGVFGNNQVSTTDTRVYNGTVSYAIVDNATLYAMDTSYDTSISQSISWLNGTFNNGVFGSDILQGSTHSAIWYNGDFNGGQFISMARWKNGNFNGGKFLSGYGWTQSSSASQSQYGWENGVFNGGEFGNANGLTNSTWYMGEFNGGMFMGRVWNNGVFSYGEFRGSGTSSPVGGLTCSNASNFVDSFTNSYWGLWRNGLVTNVKDRFVKDQKFYTKLNRASTLEKFNSPPRTAKLKNILWLSGTFSHPNGQINNSVWLDGAFERGDFVKSSFNPYVERSQLGVSNIKLSSELLYTYDFIQTLGWATSSSTSGAGATFSSGKTASWAPTTYMAEYKAGASSSGLYLYNTVTSLPAGRYKFDLDIVTYSSNINLKVNIGTYSVFDASSPLNIGTNSFITKVNGGSVSLYADTYGVGGYVYINSLSIKEVISTFNFNDDTCYWENGNLDNSDFYISKWKNGKFIIGTATGMIWQNGVSNYMNAFNVFWENGTWRNGNWYGSSFEYNGSLTSDYALQVLYRGMSWSGTSSAHIWNIFQQPIEAELNILSITASNLSSNGWSSEYYNPLSSGTIYGEIMVPFDPGSGGDI